MFPDLDTWAAGSGGMDSAWMWLLASSAWLPSSSDSPGWAWAVVEELDITIMCHWGATWLNTPLRFICLLQRVIQIKATQLEAPNYQVAEVKKKKNLLCILQTEGKCMGLHITVRDSNVTLFPGFCVRLTPGLLAGAGGLKYEGRLGNRFKWESHTHTVNPTSCSLGNGWREFGGYWVECISPEAELMTWSKFKPIGTHTGRHLLSNVLVTRSLPPQIFRASIISPQVQPGLLFHKLYVLVTCCSATHYS